MAMLLEEDESEDGSAEGDAGDMGLVIGNLSEENQELLAELSEEDKKDAKKKKKEKKEKKAKKGGKKESEAPEDGEEGEEGAEQKPKKAKKAKKKKEPKEDEEPKAPEKKLSAQKVTTVFLFCATVAACIVIATTLLPQQIEKQQARVAFDHDQYAQVYDLLYGRKLSDEDAALLEKSSLILRIQRKLDSYENYRELDMPEEALDALLSGVDRYEQLRDEAAAYNVSGEVSAVYNQILDALNTAYGLSEADALDVLASGDNITYSQRIHEIVTGGAAGNGEAEDASEDTSEVKQDVLPEEEEILDRLQETGADE